VPGVVGQLAGLGQQLLPLLAGQALVVPVGAGVLAAVVEEPLVVVLRLQRLDLVIDEAVELVQIVLDVLGNVEVHAVSPNAVFYRRSGRLT
jgi:hypothetical protein